jgi:hypothetical protein
VLRVLQVLEVLGFWVLSIVSQFLRHSSSIASVEAATSTQFGFRFDALAADSRFLPHGTFSAQHFRMSGVRRFEDLIV